MAEISSHGGACELRLKVSPQNWKIRKEFLAFSANVPTDTLDTYNKKYFMIAYGERKAIRRPQMCIMKFFLGAPLAS